MNMSLAKIPYLHMLSQRSFQEIELYFGERLPRQDIPLAGYHSKRGMMVVVMLVHSVMLLHIEETRK